MPDPVDVKSALKTHFPEVTERPSLDHPAVNVPRAQAVAVLTHLRGLGYDMLADLTAVDWAEGADPRFTVVYHLLSTERHEYIRVATDCTEERGTGDAERRVPLDHARDPRQDTRPTVATVTGIWPGANWHEREVYDMFGIRFEGHPDLRRILMWDEYPYFPLRKDFPLAGIETVLPDAEVVKETGTPVLPAPMAGGPFVASPGEINLTEAEPRAKDESWSERRPKTP